MRFPPSSTTLYHYFNLVGLETVPFPNPLTPATPSTVIELEGRAHYAVTAADLPAGVPRGRPGLDRGARAGGQLQRHAGRDPPAGSHPDQGDLEHADPDLGREHVLRLRRGLGGLPAALVPPPRDLRHGGLRHRRLGHRLPQLDAGDSARRLHRRRQRPSHGRGRGRAAAAPALAPGTRPDGPLAARHLARHPARRGAAARRGADRAHRRRAHRGHRPLGRGSRVRRRRQHLPDMALVGADRLRGTAVRAFDVDGHRAHPLHAGVQDLRHGRPAILEGPGPGHRPRRHEHDAHRPDDPRHLPDRPGRRSSRR